ncbi:MAG: AmmeMemoRadiSam system radical SAM enzyme [Arenicellales bacterium]
MATVKQSDIVPARYWHLLKDQRIQCDLCPRFCRLRDGQRGLCFVRQRLGNQLMLTTWGRSSGFCIDPIEKKPLNHFYPGSSVLSFGTAGCNLACKFCQNWDISKSREMDRLSATATPEAIAQVAAEQGCRSVAFTYNDPVIFLEYAVDIAKECRKRDIKAVAVTAGYITEQARPEFFQHMDAVNVDLKSFSQDFYHVICGGDLSPVLDTLEFISRETDAWLEITTLLIPGKNDGEEEITELVQWVLNHLGDRVPLHFTAFHPDWKMRDIGRTPHNSLTAAREIALKRGLKYVYLGNVHDAVASSTYCSRCNALLIARDWHQIMEWKLDHEARCRQCGTKLDGVISEPPASTGSRPRHIQMPQTTPSRTTR